MENNTIELTAQEKLYHERMMAVMEKAVDQYLRACRLDPSMAAYRPWETLDGNSALHGGSLKPVELAAWYYLNRHEPEDEETIPVATAKDFEFKPGPKFKVGDVVTPNNNKMESETGSALPKGTPYEVIDVVMGGWVKIKGNPGHLAGDLNGYYDPSQFMLYQDWKAEPNPELEEVRIIEDPSGHLIEDKVANGVHDYMNLHENRISALTHQHNNQNQIIEDLRERILALETLVERMDKHVITG